ncbi:MAG: beta-lactamase family protein [Cyanothece sp. SIO1E1]|nr:beta-lactamase family protein [Cyanothece sp. SIO1E1]
MKNFLLGWLLLVCHVSFSQTLSDTIDDYITPYVITGDFSGCVTISKENTIIYNQCFGKANHAFNIDNTLRTKFKIGSISKQFTATAILLLEEKGLLKTEDKLSKYFPSFRNVQDISIQQLLNHTSGIIDIFNLPAFSALSCQKTSLGELSEIILSTEVLFAPGERYQYSNGGYAILAQIIEHLTQKSYGDFLRQNIFEPLGMASTGHNNDHEIIEQLAIGYDPSGYRDLVSTNFISNELLKGSGSLYSNTDDMLKWIRALKNRSLLTKESSEKFFTNYGNNYGYGISIYSPFGKEAFGHDGRINGYIADYLHYKEDDLSVVVLGNVQSGVADFFRRDIAAIIFDKPVQTKAKKVLPAGNYPADVERILGSYAFGPNFLVHIEKIDGLIKARANEGSYSELIPMVDGKFFSRMLYSVVEFKSDKDNQIVKMIWIDNDGNTFEGNKQKPSDDQGG